MFEKRKRKFKDSLLEEVVMGLALFFALFLMAELFEAIMNMVRVYVFDMAPLPHWTTRERPGSGL